VVVIDGLSVFGGMKARFTPEGGTGTASGLKTQGLAPQACSWLFGFSPEGGTRTAGVRKPPESGPPLTPKALRAEDPEAGARDRWLTHTGRDMSPSGLKIQKQAPGTGGLRTPAEICRPPGSKTQRLSPKTGGLRTPAEICRPPGSKTQRLSPQACSWLFGFSPEGGTRTAGVRKPPESVLFPNVPWVIFNFMGFKNG